MKLLLTLLSAYIALSNAAPVTVTKTVVVRTQYSTTTVSGPPFTSAGEVDSTSTGAPVSSSAAAPSSESTSTSSPVAATPSATTTSSSAVPSSSSTTSSSAAPSSSSTTSSSAAPSSSSTTSSSLNSFEAAILEEHNVKRALHGADPLTWDSTLAQFAADYSAKTFSCDNVELVHSSGPYGENLAYMTTLGGVAPVDAWYDEISQYDYSNPGFSMATGHFTQVIWASTTKVGCAALMCNNAQYTTCEYSSAGNVIGYFPENVYPLKS